MYAIYLMFEWLGRHPVWTALGVFVIVGTIVITWIFDRQRRR